jgi:uncharacterized protein YceK
LEDVGHVQFSTLLRNASRNRIFGSGGSRCDCGDPHGRNQHLMPVRTFATTWTESVLHSFHGGLDGVEPYGALISDAHGDLYGTASLGGSTTCGRPSFPGCGIVFELKPPGAGKTDWTRTVLYSFNGSDGNDPGSERLLMDASGALYGTTYLGGGGSTCTGSADGCGTVFKLTPPARGTKKWTESVLYTFNGTPDGSFPNAGLIADASGALYSTTVGGGDANCGESPFGYIGCGIVFKLEPPGPGKTTWTESVLHAFAGADGAAPVAGVIMDKRGALYGTAGNGGGGGSTNCFRGCGTVFKLAPPAPGKIAWQESVLHSFVGLDGASPSANLFQDPHGTLYSTTASGGAFVNYGAVFELAPPAAGKTAWTESVLYSFTGGADGGEPTGDLIDDAGVFYSTTQRGGGVGSSCPHLTLGCGTVFSLTAPARGSGAWTESVLHAFDFADGAAPAAGLLEEDGAFYGTTILGGRGRVCGGCGTVFKLTDM